MSFRLPRYRGGKKSAAVWIASQLPADGLYVEAFGGMAAVLLARRPVVHELLNDADGHIMAWWRGVRDHGPELHRLLRATPCAREAAEEAWARLQGDVGVLSPAEHAAAVCVCLTQNFQAGLDSKPMWLQAMGDEALTSNSPMWLAVVDGLPALTERLRSVNLECRDAGEVVAQYVGVRRAVIYLDPPYAATRGYRVGADFEVLAGLLRDARAAVAVSGYASCGWDELLGWRRLSYTRKRSHAHNPAGEGPVEECLWVNFEPRIGTLF